MTFQIQVKMSLKITVDLNAGSLCLVVLTVAVFPCVLVSGSIILFFMTRSLEKSL